MYVPHTLANMGTFWNFQHNCNGGKNRVFHFNFVLCFVTSAADFLIIAQIMTTQCVTSNQQQNLFKENEFSGSTFIEFMSSKRVLSHQ